MRTICKSLRRMARPERFELPTLCFEGRCSIQLSYGRVVLNSQCLCGYLKILRTTSMMPVRKNRTIKMGLNGASDLSWRLSFSRVQPPPTSC